MPGGGGGGGAMPIEPWMLACGFRFVVGQLKTLNVPGTSTVHVANGIDVNFDVDDDTLLIDIEPHVIKNREMVRVNFRDNNKRAVSIERYFMPAAMM